MEQTELTGWILAETKLPEPYETVWLCNGRGWIALGCLITNAEGSHWAESNSFIVLVCMTLIV